MVRILDFGGAHPVELSGGMKQKVAIARALANDPEVIVMDEPFASLDAQTRELLQEELLRIMEVEPKTMVFITHSIDEAIVLGDRIAVMTARPGRVKEYMMGGDVHSCDPAGTVGALAAILGGCGGLLVV